MAERIKFETLALVVVVAVVAAALIESSTAATYYVGDTLGWQIPSGGASTYATWAAKHNFTVGDSLVFNFTTGSHTAAKVAGDAFNSCSTANPISLQATGPATFLLDTAGAAYFICTVQNHCSQGQKLSINVTSSGTGSPNGSPPGTTTPPPPPPPPPPPSSTASTAIAAFSLIFSSMAITLMC